MEEYNKSPLCGKITRIFNLYFSCNRMSFKCTIHPKLPLPVKLVTKYFLKMMRKYVFHSYSKISLNTRWGLGTTEKLSYLDITSNIKILKKKSKKRKQVFIDRLLFQGHALKILQIKAILIDLHFLFLIVSPI